MADLKWYAKGVAKKEMSVPSTEDVHNYTFHFQKQMTKSESVSQRI